MMDVKEYKYILSVITQGGISEAARTLHISQPSLSAYIKNLENKAGIIFFHKVDGIMHLTSAGKLYLDYAQKIVDLDEALSLELMKIQNLDSGEVNLGITATRGTLFLHRLLPVLKRRYPGILIRLTECSSGVQLEELVRRRQVDFGFLTYPFIKHQLSYEELFTEDMVVTIPASDPVCRRAKRIPGKDFPWIDLQYLRDREFILHKKGQRLRQAADELFAQANLEPRILWETASAITAYNLSAANMGLAITSSAYCLVQNSPQLRFFSLGSPPLVYKTILAYVSRETLSNSALAVIGEVKKFFASLVNFPAGEHTPPKHIHR
jgi:DNA-binding transcriptional LysR family regulator